MPIGSTSLSFNLPPRPENLGSGDVAASSGIPPTVVPVSISSDWVVANSSASVADNSGNTVILPATGLTRAAILEIPTNGRGTSLLARMSYTLATNPTVDPVIQCFGFDSNDLPMRLTNAAGTHELTCVASTANDPSSAGTAYSDHHILDLNGSHAVQVAIKTPATGGSSAEQIQVKII